MRQGRISYPEVAGLSGVLGRTIRSWRTTKNPGLESGAAVLGALGWALVPIPRHDRLPPAIAARLAALEAAWTGETSLLQYLIAGACGVPIPVEPATELALAA